MSLLKQNRAAYYYSTFGHAITLAVAFGSAYYPQSINPDIIIGVAVVNVIFAAYWIYTTTRSPSGPVRSAQLLGAIERIIASLIFIEYYKKGRSYFNLTRKSIQRATLLFLVIDAPLTIYINNGLKHSIPHKPIQLELPTYDPPKRRVSFKQAKQPPSPVATLFPGNISIKSIFSEGDTIATTPVATRHPPEHFHSLLRQLHDPSSCPSCKRELFRF